MNYTQLSTYLRSLVMGVDTKVPLLNGQYVTGINFDNAATTPPLVSVMKEITNFAPWYSSIHRGKGYKSTYCSNIYEGARKTISDFVHADSLKDTVIFTKNTTESINMLAYRLFQENREQVILSTYMEHLANDLPWRKFKIDYVNIDDKGKLSLEDLEKKLVNYQGKIGLVTASGASNVTGYINPIYEIAELAHKYGAKILVDGAQLIPHVALDMKPHNSQEHIDYLAFSSHKMYAPFGIGILIGPKETFEKGLPVYTGGGDVRFVSHDFIEFDDPPAKDEAGTPNIMGVVALVAAIKGLNSVGMDTIHEYENGLIHYAMNRLRNIPNIELYGYDDKKNKRVGLVSFNVTGIKHNVIAEILSREAGIAIRDGLFCAHPYVVKLLKLSDSEIEYYHKNQSVPLPGMVRISFGLYNNYEEIDKFLKSMERIAKNRNYYVNRYKSFLLSN